MMYLDILQTVMDVVFSVLAFALAFQCLCRISTVSGETTRGVVIVLFALGGALALFMATLPLVGPVSWLHLALLAWIVAVQAAFARGWRRGIPPSTRKQDSPTR